MRALVQSPKINKPNTILMFSKLAWTSGLGLAVSLFSSTSMAACEMVDCACKPSVLQFASPALAPNSQGKYPISLEADNVGSQGKEVVTLTGNAEVKQGRQAIVADKLKYYRNSDRVVAEGNVEVISENGDYVRSESLDVHAPTQIGDIRNSQFKLAKSLFSANGIDTVEIESRGSARLMNFEGEGLVRLQDVTYTNCNEGNNDVVIGAKSIELDRVEGVGRARHATLRFKGVPIFYSPYLSFPINDERKTGLLTPGFGSDQESGFMLEQPWYWNIAKNQDATITPRYYSDRGVQIAAEYRLKSAYSETFIYGEHLSDDELYLEENAGEENVDGDRTLFSLQHSHQFTENLDAILNYNDVSDAEYFDDYRNDVRYFSATYVPRELLFNYRTEYFSLTAKAKEYQIVDPDISSRSKPYERLPAINFSTNLPDGPWGMNYGLDASYTRFNSDARVDGTRTALTPYVMLPFETIWGYAKPKVSVYSRKYDLDYKDIDAAPQDQLLDDSPSFTMPIFSLDTGLFFERKASWFGEEAIQTLEPRLYYVYAPEEEQTNPVFDTSESSLNNFSNIFRENRFFGEDRVGDTNQVTLGVTSAVIDNESGDQRLVASIGQLYLIDDQEQSLTDNSRTNKSGLGDLLAEIRTESEGGWTSYGFIQYSHDDSELKTARVAFGYEPDTDNRKKISVGYYFAERGDNDTDQLTLSANWPVTDRWSAFGVERYSLEDSESLSSTLGLEYNACCWKIRITGNERIANRNINEKKKSLFIEFELTNLGRFRTGIR